MDKDRDTADFIPPYPQQGPYSQQPYYGSGAPYPYQQPAGPYPPSYPAYTTQSGMPGPPAYGFAGGPGVPGGPTGPGMPEPSRNPSKGGKKKRHRLSPVRLVLFIIALALLVFAASFAGYIVYTYWDGQHEYDLIAENMEVTDAGTDPTLASFNIDWEALSAINPDVVGWVYLPGTIINYPIAWREGDDAYYMKHNFGQNSVGDFGAEYGCIALSSSNAPTWTDQANYLSGHHMRNGSMFALLAKFVNSDEFNAHRTFYVLTPEGNFKLTSFSCNKVRGSRDDIIIPNFGTREEFTQYLQARLDESLVTPDPPAPAAEDIEQIIMFYTCSEPDNQYRICVYATVDEFVPAGSDQALGNSLVDQSDLDIVGNAVGERLL